MTYLCQLGQGDPGVTQLCRRWAYASTSKPNVELTIHQAWDQMDHNTCHHYYDLEENLEISQEATKLQVQSWVTNYWVLLIKMHVLKINLQMSYGLRWTEKVWLVFCLDAKIYKGELRDVQRLWAMAWATKKRRTLAITLNCILNWGIEKLCSRTYRFFNLKNRVNLEPTILQIAKINLCRVDSDGNPYGDTSCAAEWLKYWTSLTNKDLCENRTRTV